MPKPGKKPTKVKPSKSPGGNRRPTSANKAPSTISKSAKSARAKKAWKTRKARYGRSGKA